MANLLKGFGWGFGLNYRESLPHFGIKGLPLGRGRDLLKGLGFLFYPLFKD
jgi:hypothetical protein